MCTNKVYIRDRYRINGTGNFFPCGRCEACRQAAADRRARRIRNEIHDGMTAYFVTLTYKNEYIPYVRKSDLAIFCNKSQSLNADTFTVPVYRDYDFKRYTCFDNSKPLDEPIGFLEIPVFESLQEVVNLKSLNTYEKFDIQYINSLRDKVSICYSADAKNFIKRLRQNLYRINKEVVPLRYFYCPEYGPDTFRFHHHFIIWLPSSFTESEVRNHVFTAWPYADMFLTLQYTQIARNAASYVASYTNCPSDVPRFLTQYFPLRSSHSLRLGFNEGVFSFNNVLKSFEERESFKYTTVKSNTDGQIEPVDVYYPQYVVNTYFPKVKGFNRLSYDALRDVYTEPEKLLQLSDTQHVCDTTYTISEFCRTKSDLPLYASRLIDRYGNPVLFQEKEAQLYINRINRCYEEFYRPNGINRLDFAQIILDYHRKRSSQLYKDSLQSTNAIDTAFAYYNLSMLRSHEVTQSELYDIIKGLTDEQCDCNNFPLEMSESMRLRDKFHKYVKKRRVNQLT